MIELAPQRKQGLTLASPIIAASGAVGFAHEAADLITLERCGAIVTAPLSFRPRPGSAQPRLAELSGGLLLNHGDQNRGWHRTLEKFGAAWARSKAPIIAHLAGPPSEWPALAQRLEATRGIAGLEVDVWADDALTALKALRTASELPILARLPYGGEWFAADAVAAGADALVCIAPPRGASIAAHGQTIEGDVYGPLVKPLAMRTLSQVRAQVSAPLIAAGGVHCADDVRAYLACGASAVMIDSLAWVDPQTVNAILNEWAN